MSTWLSCKVQYDPNTPAYAFGHFKVPAYAFVVQHRASGVLLMLDSSPFFESIKQARLRLTYYLSSARYKQRLNNPAYTPPGPFTKEDFDIIFIPISQTDAHMTRCYVPSDPSAHKDFLDHYPVHGRPPSHWQRVT